MTASLQHLAACSSTRGRQAHQAAAAAAQQQAGGEGAGAGRRQASRRLQLQQPAPLDRVHEPDAAAASGDEAAGGFLQLPDGFFFPGCSRTRPSALFIRDCYGRLFDAIKGDEANNCGLYCIVGTPGIGKRLFVVYCMWRLQREDAPPAIVWETSKSPHQRFLFKGGKALSGSLHDFQRDLDDPGTWYIVDGKLPAMVCVDARTIMVSSTKRDDCKAFLNHGATKLTMPVWSEAEMMDCYRLIYSSSLEQGRMLGLLARYGGVPRSVFGLPSRSRSLDPAADLQDLEHALTSFNVEQMTYPVSSGESQQDHILHLDSNEPFVLQSVKFASPYVAERVAEQLRRLSSGRARALLCLLQCDSSWDGVRQHLQAAGPASSAAH